MSDLNTILKRAGREYQARKSDAESRVVRWEYFSNVAHDPRPFFFERFKVKPGRPLKSATAKAYAYGFDADGNLAVVRQPKSADEPAYEEFFARESAALVTSVAYEANGRAPKPFYATRYDFKAGRLVASDVLNAGGKDQFTERYTYRAGRLAEVGSEAREGKKSKNYRFDVQYDEKDGEFKVLRRYWDHLDRYLPIHWNPAKQPTLQSLADDIWERLLDLIPKAVARAKLKEPAYCLALAYDAAGDELPPTLAIGLERERRKLISSAPGTKQTAARVWDPKRMAYYGDRTLELRDDALAEQCQTFCQLALSKSDTSSATGVLNEVARALNARDGWRRALPVTDDFVVLAADVDGDDLAKNLKAALPPAAAMKRLKAQKLL